MRLPADVCRSRRSSSALVLLRIARSSRSRFGGAATDDAAWRPQWAKLSDFNGSFLYCRGYFEQVRGRGRRHGMVDRLSGRRSQLLGPSRRADARLRQGLEHAAQLRRRVARGSAALPVPAALHGRRRHGGVQRARSEEPARVLPEGRVSLGRRFLGIGRVARTGLSEIGSRAAARRVSDHRHSARRIRSCTRSTT